MKSKHRFLASRVKESMHIISHYILYNAYIQKYIYIFNFTDSIIFYIELCGADSRSVVGCFTIFRRCTSRALATCQVASLVA